MTLPRPLVADHNFVLATRDTGYRSLAAAVAELIDNAIQAHASEVHVVVREERLVQADGRAGDRQLTISVLDNGRGMNRDGLWKAVQFGGTERFNDRSGFGRFGMGLPNSSVSVTRRLEVYSWRSGRTVLHTYLDIDEVAHRLIRGIPEPKNRRLPPWAARIAGRSGTLVVWPRCDRLDYKKASTVSEKLRAPLGRMYRRLIWGGLRILINGEVVAAKDPLFCHPTSEAGGGSAYGLPLTYEIGVPGGRRSSTVTVRFTELPVDKWHRWTNENKRAGGIVGGSGVSFVRAGREIDYGWKLFGGKRRENYDDWWRCEVLFEPDLDELFGVTHSKQGVSPIPYLRSILEPDMEATARVLNARVRVAFEGIKRAAPSEAAQRATLQERWLPPAAPPAKMHGIRGALGYAIVQAAIPGPGFFDVTERQGVVRVTINTDHPFYERLYAPAVADPTGHQRFAIECVLLAAARASVAVLGETKSNVVNKYREAWSDALAAFLETKRARQ
jgi:hypothetical protein